MKKEPDIPEMLVVVGERGILYDFVEKQEKDADMNVDAVVEWDMINRAILEDGLLYVFCMSSYIICIKKEACENFDEM